MKPQITIGENTQTDTPVTSDDTLVDDTVALVDDPDALVGGPTTIIESMKIASTPPQVKPKITINR